MDTDPTHVRFVDFASLHALADDCGLIVDREYSFPFPRPAGRILAYSESSSSLRDNRAAAAVRHPLSDPVR